MRGWRRKEGEDVVEAEARANKMKRSRAFLALFNLFVGIICI